MDYKPNYICDDCGYDHSDEFAQAHEWHTNNPCKYCDYDFTLQRHEPNCLANRKSHSTDIISSVRIKDTPGPHSIIELWNRGAHSGTLTVLKSDALIIAKRLLEDTSHLRIEPARDTHLAASIHIVRGPGEREGVWIEVENIDEKNGEKFVELSIRHMLWLEDGTGEPQPEYHIRAYPNREWDPSGNKRRIERCFSFAKTEPKEGKSSV